MLALFSVSDFLETKANLRVPFKLYNIAPENETATLYSILRTVSSGSSTHVVVIGDEDLVVLLLKVRIHLLSG